MSRLSYHGRNHYNSVVDPSKVTLGLGLGLPNLQTARSAQALDEALKSAEQMQIEQAMLDDKLKASDWEATNEEIMDMVARESYLQWIKENEQRTSDNMNSNYHHHHNHNHHLMQQQQQQQQQQSSNATTTELASCSSWDLNRQQQQQHSDSDILAKVLSESQKAYLESLKSKRILQQQQQQQQQQSQNNANKDIL